MYIKESRELEKNCGNLDFLESSIIEVFIGALGPLKIDIEDPLTY